MLLAWDVLHYAVATASWGIYGRHKERQRNKNPAVFVDDFQAPPWINWVPIVFLTIGKATAVGVAYVSLGFYVWGRFT